MIKPLIRIYYIVSFGDLHLNYFSESVDGVNKYVYSFVKLIDWRIKMINKENVKLIKKLGNIHIENLAKEYPEYTTCVSAAAHSFSFCIFNSDSGDDAFKKQINIKSVNQDAVTIDLESCVQACKEWL